MEKSVVFRVFFKDSPGLVLGVIRKELLENYQKKRPFLLACASVLYRRLPYFKTK